MLEVKLNLGGAGLDQRLVFPSVSQKTYESNVNWTQIFCLDNTVDLTQLYVFKFIYWKQHS